MRDVVRQGSSLLVLVALGAPHALRAQAAAPTFTPAARATETTANPVAAARAARAAREAARRKLDYVPAARFAEARRRAVKAGSQGAPVHVAADQETSYTLVVRTDTSAVEQHARWDDLIIVQRGRGVVQFGERSVGRRLLAAGEYRGGTLVRPYQLQVAPGDLVRVPAGVPHAFWPEGAEPLELTVVKIRRGDRPIAPR